AVSWGVAPGYRYLAPSGRLCEPYIALLFDQPPDRAERRLQVLVELAVDRIAAVVERPAVRVDGGRVLQADDRIARLGHGRVAAGPDLREDGDAERRALGRLEGVDVVAVDVGLD